MQLTSGTVVDGKIVMDGDALPEGMVVTILARESNETFLVPPDLEGHLTASIAEADGNFTVSANDVLRSLRRRS